MSAIHRLRTTVVLLITALAAALSVVALGPAPAAEARMTLTEIQSMSPDTYEAQLHALINKKRANRGLRKLAFDSCADTYSESWAQSLADRDAFYHQSLTPFFEVCHARYAAEIIAKGYWSPAQTVNAWMNSSAHRRILLKAKPRRLGIGAVLDSSGRWTAVANFTL